MILPSWVARLLSRPARRPLQDRFLLDPRRWRYAAECERMRVDRNGSVLSVVTLGLNASQSDRRRLALLEEFLGERLRLTDTAGWRDARRIGLLLPDTPRSGAEVVAGSILEFTSDWGGAPSIEIDTYPDSGGGRRAAGDAQRPVGAGLDGGAEGVFVRATPLWKRSVDVTFAGLALIPAGPLLAVLAAAVALTSPGGAFFRQKREGLGGRTFEILKLRTMVVDADSQKAALREQSVQDGPAFKMYSDPRVTTVGRFLRATSLDELPQLINVLRGDMSLVGPRPLPVEESQSCSGWQRQRLQVTPGITCIWQVRGRNTVTFEEWMRMDMRYLRGRSLWADLRLLFATPFAVVLARGPR